MLTIKIKQFFTSKIHTVILNNTPFVDILRLLAICLGSHIVSISTDAIQNENHVCFEPSGHKNTSIPSIVSGNEYTDMIADPVREQYRLLPYPHVGMDMLQLENQYYNSNLRDIPLIKYYSSSLEYINHFLYEGNNDFR